MTMNNSLWMQNFNNIMMKNMDIFNMSINNTLMMTSITLILILLHLMKNKSSMKFNNESNEMEMFWTMMPMIIILIIAMPSMFMLYCYEENKFSFMDIKILANQWYWVYEYPNKKSLESYIKKSEFMRCLNTSNSLILPINKNVRLVISSNDVIHSWSIPSIMSKMDAIPGRLNMMMINVNKPILMKGQCSEICGINHSFMPISLMTMNN